MLDPQQLSELFKSRVAAANSAHEKKANLVNEKTTSLKTEISEDEKLIAELEAQLLAEKQRGMEIRGEILKDVVQENNREKALNVKKAMTEIDNTFNQYASKKREISELIVEKNSVT